MDTAEAWADARGLERDRVDVGGVRLHRVAAGDPDDPLVVLLHGFPEFWYAWRDHLEPLAGDYRVVAPDLRGYNLSDRPRRVRDYRLAALRRDVVGLLDAAGADEAALVGHDWGGSVALSVARHRPHRVGRLVVANTVDPERVPAQLRGRQLLRSWYAGLFQVPWLPERLLALGDYRPLRATVADAARPDAVDAADLRRYGAAWARPGAVRAGVNYYRALGRSLLRQGVSGREPAPVDAPTRLLWGERDAALRPEVADRLAAGVRDVDVVRFPDATHWLHVEAPERFRERVTSFLAR